MGLGDIQEPGPQDRLGRAPPVDGHLEREPAVGIDPQVDGRDGGGVGVRRDPQSRSGHVGHPPRREGAHLLRRGGPGQEPTELRRQQVARTDEPGVGLAVDPCRLVVARVPDPDARLVRVGVVLPDGGELVDPPAVGAVHPHPERGRVVQQSGRVARPRDVGQSEVRLGEHVALIGKGRRLHDPLEQDGWRRCRDRDG